MPLDIEPIQVQSKFPLEKKPSLDPGEKEIYNDVFSLQNAFKILFLVLDNTFTKIQDYINGIVEGIPEAPIDGQIYGRKDADWEPVVSGGGGGGSGMAAFTMPPTTGWTLVNFGTGTQTNLADRVIFAPQLRAYGANRCAAQRALPAGTDWTIIAAISGILTIKQFMGIGLGVFDNTNRFEEISHQSAAARIELIVQRFSALNTYVSTPAIWGVTYPQISWFRIQSTATTLSFSISLDGVTWWIVYSEARTAWLTATKVGLTLSPENVGTPNSPVVASLLSWTETTP